MLNNQISFGAFKPADLQTKLDSKPEGSAGVLIQDGKHGGHQFMIVKDIVENNGDSVKVDVYRPSCTGGAGVYNQATITLNPENWNIKGAVKTAITTIKTNTPDAVDHMVTWLSDFVPGEAGKEMHFQRDEKVVVGPEGAPEFDSSHLDLNV